MHSCGSIRALIPDLIEAGFDILNPVQWTAGNMDPQELKNNYGYQIVFWGGGIDTQKTLPFSSPDQVRDEVINSINIFGKGGGFVFSSIHNIQPQVPVENILAMYETFQKHRS
jgi:uroporphyrinogen-III decarboxylase